MLYNAKFLQKIEIWERNVFHKESKIKIKTIHLKTWYIKNVTKEKHFLFLYALEAIFSPKTKVMKGQSFLCGSMYI